MRRERALRFPGIDTAKLAHTSTLHGLFSSFWFLGDQDVSKLLPSQAVRSTPGHALNTDPRRAASASAEARRRARAHRKKVPSGLHVRDFARQGALAFTLVLLVLFVVGSAGSVSYPPWLSRRAYGAALSSAHRPFWLLLPAAVLLLATLSGLLTPFLLARYRRVIRSPQDAEDITGYQPMALLPRPSDVAESVFDDHLVRFAAQVEGAYRRTGSRSFLFTPCELREESDAFAQAVRDKLIALGLRVVVVAARELFSPQMKLATMPQGLAATSAESFPTQALKELNTKYDLVLIQATALLASVEVEYLARYADSTLLMVQCGITARRNLHAATLLLEHIEATGIEIILEHVPPKALMAQHHLAHSSATSKQHQGGLGLSDLVPRTTPADLRETVPEETNAVGSTQQNRAQPPATQTQIAPLPHLTSQPAPAPSAPQPASHSPSSLRTPRPLANWNASEQAAPNDALSTEEQLPSEDQIETLYLPLEDFDLNVEPVAGSPIVPIHNAWQVDSAAMPQQQQSQEGSEAHLSRWERIPLLRPSTRVWERAEPPMRDAKLASPTHAPSPYPETPSDTEDNIAKPAPQPLQDQAVTGHLSRRWSLLSRYLNEQGTQDEKNSD